LIIDQFVVIESTKAVVEISIGLLLLRGWIKTVPRFTSDLPFIMGICTLFTGTGEGIDALFDSEVIPYTLELFKIRYVAMGLAGGFFLFALTNIWLRQRQILNRAIPLVFGVGWITAILIADSRVQIYTFSVPFLVGIFIPFVTTFAMCYLYKRLPEVHSLLIVGGMVAIMIGQSTKAFMMGLGLAWISEVMDLLGYVVVYLSFNIKPPYAKPLAIPTTRL
jgi:hypothetical protein